ncbi:PH domain-containing protein [Nocardia farcinica]|uniref:PH domain-containing protein n=1 Tax=Nocardia farcinica TaxID=37329 RepID=UPI0024555460|nr:PH domain-containing protein [Nocardia farcinica]
MPVVRLWRRTDPAASAAAGQRWEFEVRPRRAVRTAWIVAVLILAVFTVGGVFLRNGSTGVHFRLADQIAMIVVGALVAGGVLLLTPPRVRGGGEGGAGGNGVGGKQLGWGHNSGVSLPGRQ